MKRVSASAASIFALVLVACADRVPDPVALAVAPEAVNAGSYVQLDGTGSHDPQQRSLTYSWVIVSRPVGSNAQLIDANTPMPSFLADVPGEYVIELTVSNSLFSSKSQVTVIVSTCRATAPVVNAIHSSKSPMNIGDTTQLTADVTDADNVSPCSQNQTFTYTWELLRQPAGSAASLNNAHSETPSLTADKGGDYVVRLTVTDSTGLSSQPKTFTVTAGSCGAATPTVTASATPDTTNPNAAVQLSAMPSDADVACGVAQTFTYQWSVTSKPDGATASFSNSRNQNPTFTADKKGAYELSVVATDNTGRSSEPAIANVTVADCGDAPPAVDGIAVTSGASGLGGTIGTTIALAAVNARSLSCLASALPAVEWGLAVPAGSRVALSDPAAATPSFTPDQPGDYLVSLRVRDSLGAESATVFLNIRVFDCTPTPIDFAASNIVVTVTDPQAAAPLFVDANGLPLPNVGAAVRLTPHAGVSGYCGLIPTSPLTFSWAITQRPQGSEAQLDSATADSPTFRVDKNGHYRISGVAIDALGHRSTAQNLELDTSSCGNNPIAAAIQDVAGAAPFDDHILTAVHATGRSFFTDDDDPSKCPARFAGNYSFNWSVPSSAPESGFAFDSTHGTQVTFTPGGNAVYNVRLVIAGALQQADVLSEVFVSCADVVPRTGPISLAGSTPGYPGKFFRDDVATLSAAPSSLCFSPGSSAYSYVWSLTSPVGSSSVLGSVTSPSPTFAVDVAAGMWTASVAVVDKLGNRSLPTTATFTSEPCGINDVVASIAPPTRPSGSLAFDPYALAASAHSDDDDVARCPARFAQTYSYAFSVTSVPNQTLTQLAPLSATGVAPNAATSTTLRPGGNATYTVAAHAVGSKSLNGATASQQIVVLCADGTPTKVTSPAISLVTPPAGDVFARATGQFFRDDILTLTTTASSACFSAGNTAFTYAWTLSPVNPPALSGATTRTPSFTVNTPGGAYTATVVATDSLQNSSLTGQSTFTADSCGANPITATAAATQATGALPMDPWTLTASPASGTHFSDDSDSTKCPARFARTYTFAWSSADPLASAFSSTTTNPTTFTPAASKSYAIHLVVSGNDQTGTVDTTVNATCAAPTVDTPTVVQVSGASPGATIYVGDAVTVGTSATSACFASPTFTYAFTLHLGSTTAPEAFSPSSSVAQPSFTPQTYGGAYSVAVTISDGSGQSTASSALSINVSQCGSAAPVVSLVQATQHFDSIHRATGSAPFPALDPTLTPPATEPTVTEGGDEFPVPFYLATPVSGTVKIDSAVSGSCSSFNLVSARLLDPDGTEVGTTDFTSPSPGSVADQGTIDFSFTPRIGDHNDINNQPVPGDYQLKVTVSYGRPQTPSQNELDAATVHIAGRCGLNAPFPDLTFNPLPPTVAGTTVSADASPTSDADNVPLQFGAGPPSFSTGCGLDQQLTYAWALSSPTGSSAALSATAGLTTSFTTDIVGNYGVQLTVGDGTTSGVNGDGTATTSFPYEAQAALVFSSQPTTGTTAVTLDPFVVEFQNGDGSPCAACSAEVTISIQSGSGGTLGGTATLTGTGSVTFSDLTLSQAGTYVLTATSATTGAATSAAIVISDPAP